MNCRRLAVWAKHSWVERESERRAWNVKVSQRGLRAESQELFVRGRIVLEAIFSAMRVRMRAPILDLVVLL